MTQEVSDSSTMVQGTSAKPCAPITCGEPRLDFDDGHAESRMLARPCGGSTWLQFAAGRLHVSMSAPGRSSWLGGYTYHCVP